MLGGGEQGALLAALWNALGKDKEKFLPVLTAVATASADSAVARDVQNKATGSAIPLTDPLKPTTAPLTPEQKGQADFAEELAAFEASANTRANSKGNLAKNRGDFTDSCPTNT